jgi:hypothetical protein
MAFVQSIATAAKELTSGAGKMADKAGAAVGKAVKKSFGGRENVSKEMRPTSENRINPPASSKEPISRPVNAKIGGIDGVGELPGIGKIPGTGINGYRGEAKPARKSMSSEIKKAADGNEERPLNKAPKEAPKAGTTKKQMLLQKAKNKGK